MVKKKIQEFRKEFNNALKTALIAAFGFLIALVWRDVIQEAANNIAELSPIQTKLIGAIIVTFICVVGILVISKIFVERKEKI